MFLHRKPEEAATFRRIVTKGGATLKLTHFHLLYATERCNAGEKLQLVHAKDLRVHQCVYVVDADADEMILHGTRVLAIEEVHGG